MRQRKQDEENKSKKCKREGEVRMTMRQRGREVSGDELEEG